MTEEEKMMKRLSDLFSRETPTYTSEQVENAIRGMIIDALDNWKNLTALYKKP